MWLIIVVTVWSRGLTKQRSTSRWAGNGDERQLVRVIWETMERCRNCVLEDVLR